MKSATYQKLFSERIQLGQEVKQIILIEAFTHSTLVIIISSFTLFQENVKQSNAFTFHFNSRGKQQNHNCIISWFSAFAQVNENL